jgi:hypothetical protein
MDLVSVPVRPYAFLGTTQSLCPECHAVVPAKIIARGQRVYFRKRCPTHGLREDFVCSDRAWYDRYEYSLPAKIPAKTFVDPQRGCPLDCGLCSEHEQHTCIGVVEITDNCNLTCPLCYAASRPGQKHRSLEEVKAAIDALVRAEGKPDVVQISGGEPTLHPELGAILDYAWSKPIDYVMINTNGIRLAKDPWLLEKLATARQRVEIYFQMDGLADDVFVALRGQSLLEIKLQALERIAQAGLHVTLVATLQGEVNLDQLGPLVHFAAARPWITGLSFQPATYSGRYVLPSDLEKRVTFPDVIQGLSQQTQGYWKPSDFIPLPCAHPNCHIFSMAFRHAGRLVPLTRFVDAQSNLDLLANGLSFTREEGRRLIQLYLSRQQCCESGGCGAAQSEGADGSAAQSSTQPAGQGAGERVGDAAENFFAQTLAKRLGAEDLLRITITSFLDAYNFDVRRVMKCCTHHVLPSGHIIPFCAYNVLYRPGHVPLPPLSSEYREPDCV